MAAEKLPRHDIAPAVRLGAWVPKLAFCRLFFGFTEA
jgi:hypothetical protein